LKSPVPDKLRARLSDKTLIPPKSRVLVALSGGADSVVLLHCLLAIGPDMEYTLFAAHLNHGIRGESADADEEFCRRLCKDWDVPLYIGKADCLRLSKERGQSLEEAARDARYAFLLKTADDINADRIAVAHHMDDQAETVLLNLLRGTGALGFRAMPSLRGRIARPLLSCSRQELREYAKENGLSFVQDETNSDLKYARNRLRSLEPELKRINLAYVKNVCSAAELLAEDDDALCSWAELEFKKADRGDGVDCKAVTRLPAAVGSRVVRAYAKKSGLTADLSRKHTDALVSLCAGKTGCSLDLPHGFCAFVDYGVLTIRPSEKGAEPENYCVPLSLYGETPTPFGTITAETVPRPDDLSEGEPFSCFVSAEAFIGAVVRGRLPGDVIRPIGAPGGKKLKDYYIDKKIKRQDRSLPVVAVGQNVLWAVGAGLSQLAAVGGQTTILSLKFTPQEKSSAK